MGYWGGLCSFPEVSSEWSRIENHVFGSYSVLFGGVGKKFIAEENHVFGCYSAETGSKRWGHMQPNIWKSCVHVAIINFATKHIKKFATKHVKKFV